MFEDLNEKWRQDIENKKVVLLGEISVSDEEYNHLRNVFRKYIIRNDNYPVAPNLSISMFLVQAAIREYTGGKYWDTVGKMINQPISQKVRNKTNEIFYKTISSYDLFMLPEKENGIKLYLEMIKAHAFVTNNYMNGFFDFVNAYFETVLFRQLSQKNVSEDLSALSTFMRETLEDGDDILITRKNDKVPKIYRLLKSTRSVIAYIDSERLTKLLYPMLKCVDDYFYDSVLPNDMGNRFNKSFCSWVQFQEYEVAGEKRTHIRRVSSRKPYIFIDEYGRAMLNIPQQKFRQEECAGFARAEVIFGDEQEDEKGTLFDGGEIVECDLDVYKQWGLYISDELSVPVPHLFESITIRIYGASEEPIKEFYISSSNYRILDIHNKETRALKNGENKLLIASDLHPVVNENAEIISREPAGDWVIYSIKCSVDSEIKIGDKKLRFTNKDFTDAEYENEEDNELNTEYYTVTDAVGNIIKCTHTHPIITIYTDRIYENGIVIYVNHDKLPLKWIKIEFEDAINVMNDLSFKDKVSIVVNLEKIFCSESGFYEVSADVPSKNVPYSICRYICVPNNFTVKRNRRVYQGNCDFLATIRQNTENAIDFEPLFNCEISDRHYAYNVISRQYKTTAADTENQVQFKFSYVGREFVMSIPAPKFKFGGSAESMAYKFDPNWYKDIPDNMYVCIPGAFYMRIMFEWDNKQHIADGEFISDYTFRFDMREINGVIKSVNNRCSMHLSVFTSDKIPAKYSIVIQRQLKIEPEITSKSVTFDFVENNLVIHIDKILFKDKATLYAEIENVIDHLIVYDGALTEGDNIIGNIDSTKDYIIRPYMVEKNGLFGTVRTFMRWVTVNGRFSIANIANYHVNIAAVFNKGEKLEINNYLYGIDRLDKSETDDGVFYGRFYAVPCNDGKPDFKNKKLIGKVCMNIDISSIENEQKSVCTMSMLETEYGEYAEPYYDIERKMIISPGNKRLLGKDYDKFLPLFEDETTFCLELKHRKEQKNVIQTN